MTVGVLALQGDFEAHQRALHQLGVATRQVRSAAELAAVDGLVLPGGESTTMLKLIDEEGLRGPLENYGRPMLGCCAGAILMASEVTAPDQGCLSLLDMSVERNAYGRQVHSAVRKVRPSDEFERRTEPGELEAVFIRAPKIRRVGDSAKTLAADESGPILVESGERLALTFHPELTADRRIQRLLLAKIQG